MENNFFKKLREAKGLTQEEVAHLMGVSVNTVQNWERSKSFKTTKLLHDLLDLYGVSDVTRSSIILDVYGRKSENDHAVMTEKAPECVALKQAVERLAGEKDAHYVPYPLDKTCTCLEIIDSRIRCLETAIEFLETHYFKDKSKLISGWETAILIDLIGREYDVEAGATEFYQIQENNQKVDELYPCGDEDDWIVYSEEFGCELDCEEYFDKLKAKVERKRSPVEEQREALGNMRKDFVELSAIRERILGYLCQQGCWEKEIDISGLLDVNGGLFWEVVTVLRTGKSYKKASTPQRMAWFLAPERDNMISIDKRSKKRKTSQMELYCDAVYQSKVTVQQALQVMGRVLERIPYDFEALNMTEWAEVCQQSTVLKERLMQYM